MDVHEGREAVWQETADASMPDQNIAHDRVEPNRRAKRLHSQVRRWSKSRSSSRV